MLVLAVGCGGVEDGVGVCEHFSKSVTIPSTSMMWICSGDNYAGSCKVEHAPGGVDITCTCSLIYELDIEMKSSHGTIRILGDYNDNMPPTSRTDFIEYVRSVPACEWWSPPI